MKKRKNPLKATEVVKLILKEYIYYGSYAVDCTCGNGNDTYFLAEQVGTMGKVWGFEI